MKARSAARASALRSGRFSGAAWADLCGSAGAPSARMETQRHRRRPERPVGLRDRQTEKTIVIGFAALQHNIWFRKNRRTEIMVGTTFFFVTLAALVAVKSA